MSIEILMDVDGVVADFSTYLLKTVGSRKRLRDIVTWDIKSYLTPEQHEHMTASLGEPSGRWWYNQPVVRGAKKGIQDLTKNGHVIHWVTSPWFSCSSWESVRRNWLYRHFGAKFNDITFTFQKHRIQGDVIIDDKAEHVISWVEHQMKRELPVLGIIFDAPYNQDTKSLKGLPIVRATWADIPDLVFGAAKALYRKVRV